mmetsp:Transcript_47132/g.135000  ORF Transcript_47132/g.135000 Transcript_47132/m.135000 type:complete len:127 (+) Transcript_47132:487-867(+)
MPIGAINGAWPFKISRRPSTPGRDTCSTTVLKTGPSGVKTFNTKLARAGTAGSAPAAKEVRPWDECLHKPGNNPPTKVLTPLLANAATKAPRTVVAPIMLPNVAWRIAAVRITMSAAAGQGSQYGA